MLQTLLKNINRKRKYYQRDVRFLFDKRGVFAKARGARMIIYHGLCKTQHTKFNARFVTVKIFERHLALYKKYCNVLSLDDYYQQKFSNDKFNLCITFDDGLANNYTYALPLLEKYNLPATFFITGISAAGHDVLWNDFLSIVSHIGPNKISFKGEAYVKNKQHKYVSGSSVADISAVLRATGFEDKQAFMQQLYALAPFKNNPTLTDYWLQMTEEQIRQLSSSSLVTIGSHGYYHNDLALLPAIDLYDELTMSKSCLQNITGKQVSALAFPYGSYNRAVVNAAKAAGYSQLLAMELMDGETGIAIKERFTINPYISAHNQLYANITGRYE